MEVEKIYKTKSWFFEEIKPTNSARLTNYRDNILIANIWNVIETVTPDPAFKG